MDSNTQVLSRGIRCQVPRSRVKIGAIVGAFTTALIPAGQGYELSSDADIVALLVDTVFGLAINFLVWGSLVNLVEAAIRAHR